MSEQLSTLGTAALAYAEAGIAVIPLASHGKVPTIKSGVTMATSDIDEVRTWWEKHPNDNIGIACGSVSGGLVAIDVDIDEASGKDGMETLRKWEILHGELPDTASSVTGSGGQHFLFRTTENIHPSVNQEAAVDIRSDGSYIVAPPSIHPNGNLYSWENDIDCLADADFNTLQFIGSVQKNGGNNDSFKLPKEIKPGERNDTLFRYACSLQAQGVDDDLMLASLAGANNSLCDNPVSDSELHKIIESAANYEKGKRPEPKKAEESKPWQLQIHDNKGRIIHNNFGRVMLDVDHVCRIDGAPAVWKDNRYALGLDEIARAILTHDDACKQRDQNEIIHYLDLKMPKISASDPSLIAFKNGVYDMSDDTLKPYSPDMVITNIIPHNYVDGADDDYVQHVLSKIACDDDILMMNLMEILGVCMYRSNEFAQCPVLLGNGSNGKSTYIKMIRALLGNDNVSALDIGILGKPFQATQLMSKLANLGDDVSNDFLKGDVLAVFKKIATGEWIYSDVKNGKGFNFKPYCTMVFSANEFPRLGDYSDGMMRRLFPLEFNARFSPTDDDYDPRITQKVTSESACECLAYLGIIGLHSVIAHNGFTPNGAAATMAKVIKHDNDTVLQWIEDMDIEVDSVTSKSVGAVYEDYSDWCKSSGCNSVAKNTFGKRMKSELGVTARLTRKGFDKPTKVFGVLQDEY